jgi:hypothetical protein
LLDHRGECRLRHVEGGLQRDLELPLQVLGRELVEGRADSRSPGLDHAGRVDEDLDRAERLLRPGDQLEGLIAIGEVGDVREDVGVCASQLRGAGLDPLGRSRGDRDARAEARYQPGRREPDSLVAAAARDEGVPAGEVEGVVCAHRDEPNRLDVRERTGITSGSRTR